MNFITKIAKKKYLSGCSECSYQSTCPRIESETCHKYYEFQGFISGASWMLRNLKRKE